MRLFASLFTVLFAVLPSRAAQEEFRAPEIRDTPALKATAPQLPVLPQLGVPQLGIDSSAPEVQTPLADGLGVKPDSQLAPALAPVGQELSAPNPGADAGAGKEAADADWSRRQGERPLNIVLAAAESVPLIKTGGLADVIDAIGRGFAARGHNVSIFLPKHAQVKTGGLQFRKLDAGVEVPVAGRVEKGTLWEADHQGVRVFLVEHDGFFKRDDPYSKNFGSYSGDYPDNDERFIFFSRAVLEASKTLNLAPDIIHSHDWHAALTAPMLKLLYGGDKALAGAKAVVTLHNMAFQGNFEAGALEKAGFDKDHADAEALRRGDRFSFLESGIRFADAVTTVSPTYAREIQDDPKFGMGLETVLKGRAGDLHGVINGVDHEMWNPATDGVIGRNYGAEDVELGKAAAKKALQGHAGFTVDPDAPLFGVAARLAHQKGLDLVAAVAPKLVEMGAQLFVLGSGDKDLEKKFQELAAQYPKSIFLHPFDEYLPRRVFAASDFLFMPSRFEPCGLSQLMAQRYGSLPIVTKTGGLADTVTDVRDDAARGDGLFVKEFSPEALAETVAAAIAHYKDEKALAVSRRTAMTKDSSWDASVERYLSLFRSLLDQKPPSAQETPKETPEVKKGALSRAANWIKGLNRALDARSVAEKFFWFALFGGLAAGALAPALWKTASLASSLPSLILGALIPFLSLIGLSGARFVSYLRHGLSVNKPLPRSRVKTALLAAVFAGLLLGVAPSVLRVPLTTHVLPLISQEQQDIRPIAGTAFRDEVVNLLSVNPVGRKVLDELRDRSGALRLPPFYLSKQSDSVAAHSAVVDGVFIDEPNVTAHGWTPEQFLADPAKQRIVAQELVATLVHELTHAGQARRAPANAKEFVDGFRFHLHVEAEHEAFLNEHFFVFEQLKADPHAKLPSEGYGTFLGAMDDLDGFLKMISETYPKDKNIDTIYYREYFARLRAAWPAHSVECHLLLAQRALPNMPRVAKMELEKARKIAAKNGLPEPQLDIPEAPLSAPSAK